MLTASELRHSKTVK